MEKERNMTYNFCGCIGRTAEVKNCSLLADISWCNFIKVGCMRVNYNQLRLPAQSRLISEVDTAAIGMINGVIISLPPSRSQHQGKALFALTMVIRLAIGDLCWMLSGMIHIFTFHRILAAPSPCLNKSVSSVSQY